MYEHDVINYYVCVYILVHVYSWSKRCDVTVCVHSVCSTTASIMWTRYMHKFIQCH